MPDSLLVHLYRSAMVTAHIGMATRAQYSRQVPNRSTTVHTRATGLLAEIWEETAKDTFNLQEYDRRV